MSESGMRGNVVLMLKELDALAVENPCYPGTPDVNCVGDWWLELKWLRSWPKQGGAVKIDHYTQQQKLWLRRRHLKGGKVALLLQCQREWFMFRFPELMEVGTLTRIELTDRAFAYTNEGMKREKLLSWLR